MEKESKLDDFSTINLENYSEQKQKKQCTLNCNPIVLFIIAGFIFVIFGILQMISTFMANQTSIPLTKTGKVITSAQPTYLSYNAENRVGIYLQIQKVSQFNQFASKQYLPQSIFQCQTYNLNQELNKTVAIDGTVLDPTAQAIPCGFYAGMLPFNTITATYTNGSAITIDTADLTNFNSDFGNINRSVQWADLTSNLFQSWMEPNAELKTTKLIGRFASTLEGVVNITININNDIPGDLGIISLLLEPQQSFGQYNLSLTVLSFVQALVLFLFAFFLFYYGKYIDTTVNQYKKGNIFTVKADNRSERSEQSRNI